MRDFASTPPVVSLPKPTHCFELMAIVLARLSKKPSKIDDGKAIENETLNYYASGIEAEIVDPHDGQRYRISIEPIRPSANAARAAA